MSALLPEIVLDEAPGAPGLSPTWCRSSKELVGCALGPSRVWFTIGAGIVNEVYYPRCDIPQIRDLGFIVGDGKGFWVEVKRLGNHELRAAAPGVPAIEIAHRHERFELILRVTPDPARDVLLLQVELNGDARLRPYVLLAPHLGGSGHQNEAEVGEYRFRRVLWAEQGPFGLALAAVDAEQRDAWGGLSVGYVGTSDGWQDFARNGAMQWRYRHAGPGNVAMMGELPRHALLALGFGSSKESAATLAASAVLQRFDDVWRRQVEDWQAWHARCSANCDTLRGVSAALQEQARTSAMVLRTHQDKIYPGAMVASLSIPWGSTRDERGGYHLVWPRDLVECAGALLALGAIDEARDVLRYLIATQHADGHWFQNQWLGSKPYWQGVQLDETAFPVLLSVTLAERGMLDGIEIRDMIRRALGFIARTGPSSPQDRWEEDAGINTFTLSVCISALVAGADWLDAGDRELALALADYWNAHMEDWTAVFNTPTAKKHGVHGYYVRVAPARAAAERRALMDVVQIKNRPAGDALPADDQIGTDFLQLVRFGLRCPDDPLVVDSIRIVDALLKVETPSGPTWHRYNGDGYGEHADGGPFDGIGIGRGWPLLTGERGHFELAAKRDPLPFLDAMIAMSGPGGMIPEQVWDTTALPRKDLAPGRPSGSAMPLAWAHAEFIKLLFSRARQQPIDRPQSVWQRYAGRRPVTERAFWFPHAPIGSMPAGTTLVVGLYDAAVVRWAVNSWDSPANVATRESGLGIHVVDLDTRRLKAGERILFTFRVAAGDQWAGADFEVAIT
jgi:glucoamylase